MPREIGGLNNIEVFDMGGNQLNGSLPSEIGNMTALVLLYLRANNLIGKLCPQIKIRL